MDLMRGFEIAYKLQEYHLTRVDRLSMAHGLEVRVPYLRDQVVSWALSRPADKLVAGEAKQPLREAAAGYLPPASLSRPKKKYSAPARLWLRGPLRGLTQELLHTGDGVTELGLNPRAVAALARRFDRDPGADTATVWGVLVLLAWYSLVYTRLRDMRAGRS
jgi:asparagine synthase (glutamine-hydrolysing)